MHVVYTQPIGLLESVPNATAEWIVKIKNAMPLFADNPMDLHLFGLGFATISNRPNSDDAVAQAKNYLYAQPYNSVDQFKLWVRNAEENNSLPVNVYEYFDLDSMRTDEDDWYISLPQIIASNFATMPHVAPHIKMLTFVHQMLSYFVGDEKNPMHTKGDKDMVDEIKRTIERVGIYVDRVVYHIDVKGDATADAPDELSIELYNKISDRYDVSIDKIKYSSVAFDWYYALMQNCFNLAMSGGKMLDGLTIIPYDRMLKWEHLFLQYKK